MSESVVFALSVGNAEILPKSKYLVKSIRKQYPDARILSFVTTRERETIEETKLSFFERHTSLVEGTFPHHGYPISSKLRAMTLAADSYEFDYLILLDSDTLLRNNLNAFLDSADEADFYAKPEHTAGKIDFDQWLTIYEDMDYTEPKQRVVTTVDKHRIHPFYNAGVVVTTSDRFPKKWMDLTVKIFETISEKRHFADQIALGLLSQEFEVSELSELENYPLHKYTSVPEDVLIVHYYWFACLTKMRDKDGPLLKDLGIVKQIPNRSRFIAKIREPSHQFQTSIVEKALRVSKRRGWKNFITVVLDRFK